MAVKTRRVLSIVFLVIAAILIPVAATAVWASRTVLNEDRFTSTVTSVTKDPAVVDALATAVTDQAVSAVSGSAVIEKLPAAIQPAVPVIIGALRGQVQSVVSDVISSPTGQKLVEDAVRLAHRRAMKVLQGDGLLNSSAFTVENGVVTLDLRALIRQALLDLQKDGVIPASITLPAPDDPPSQLGQRLGVQLPDDFGQIVVYRTDNASIDNYLDQAQRALVVAKRSVVLLVVLALAAAIAAIAVAPDRRRTTYLLAAGVLGFTILLVIVARRAAAAVPDAASTAAGKAVASALADALRSSLMRVLTLLGGLAAVIGLLARFWHPILRVVRANVGVATGVAVGLGLLVLLVWGLGWGSLLLAVLVVALGLFVVWYAKSTPAQVMAPALAANGPAVPPTAANGEPVAPVAPVAPSGPAEPGDPVGPVGPKDGEPGG